MALWKSAFFDGFWHPMPEDGRTFTCIGSPHYMAPEDHRGDASKVLQRKHASCCQAILSRREGYGTEATPTDIRCQVHLNGKHHDHDTTPHFPTFQPFVF